MVMPKKFKSAPSPSKRKRRSSAAKAANDIVVTPGGPRPKRLVKEVGSHETVCFDAKHHAKIRPLKLKSSIRKKT